MRNGLGILGVILLALANTLAATAAPPLRILPLGDSITSGCCLTVEGGYRTRLYALLAAAGYNPDFIGNLGVNSNNPQLPDPDHEGHGGAEISALDAGIEAWCSAIEDPDVVLLLIGTNDFASNRDPSEARIRLENLIAHLATFRPHALIFVANLLQRTDLPNADRQIQTSFNPYIPGIVSHQASLGRHVYFVDLRSACGPADLSDGLHPTLAGYNKVADAWFTAITPYVGPNGTGLALGVSGAHGQVDLRHVAVTFSKPVDDRAADPGNFAMTGGLTVLGAEVDPQTKRTVILTTSLQTMNTLYRVTVNGVRDRTPQANWIAANSLATFVSGGVAEAANYTLAYSLRIPSRADFNSRGVPYFLDKHLEVGPYLRIAYYLELQQRGGPLRYIWASMDAFTSDVSKIGVPSLGSGGFFQQPVANVSVRSSLLSSTDGAAGQLEFWPGDYSPENATGVLGASNSLYDWGDRANPGQPGYGSMQLHIPAAGQTLFAYNGWGGAGLSSDLGLGNSPGGSSDWTFTQNAAGYVVKNLEVYVLPNGAIPSAPVITGEPTDLTVSLGGQAMFSVTATGLGSISYQWRFNGAPIPGANGPSYLLQNVQATQAGTYDVVVSNSAGTAVSGRAQLVVLEGDLLLNGGFEAGLAGWMSSGDIGVTANGPLFHPTEGLRLVVFNAGNAPANGFLLQGFETTPGQDYVLSFDAGIVAYNQNEQRLGVTVQGAKTLVSRTVSMFGVGNGTSKWFPQSYPFTADSSTTTLTFRDLSPSSLALDMLLDKVRLVRTGPIIRTLTVASSNPASGAQMRLAPLDAVGRGNGVTGLTRTFRDGTVVLLTAANVAAGNTFDHWEKDGVEYARTPRTSLLADRDYVLTAVYVPTRALLVKTVNPSNGMTIRVGPPDNSGAGNGVAEFTRFYRNGTLVVLKAPPNAGGNAFLKWQKDGVDISSSPQISVTMDSNHTITAVY